MPEPTNPVPDNAEPVIPNEEAPSGHGGSAPAPRPHPLTPDANKDDEAGELSDPDNTNQGVDEEDLK